MPFFLCILALIPSVKGTYEWLELKTLDLLFTFYPQICETFGKLDQLDPQTVIITKDQSFQSKFGRSPNRQDFAMLIKKLREQGVKVAAIDFIFDENEKEEEDREFAKELKLFPYPILAQSFVSRGLQNFSYVDIRDENANRPVWPNSLYKPFSDNAATKGLINIQADFDSVIRHIPLAYHPDESEDFLPTLGFAAYIATLLENEEQKISSIDISNASDLEEALEKIYKKAPYSFYSTGHEGLDRCIFNLESVYICRQIIRRYPQLVQANFEDVAKAISAKAYQNKKSWLKTPSQPLPIIGNYHTPSLRIPYKKQAIPLINDSIEIIGDGIRTHAMTRLLDTEEETNSAFMFGKNKFNLPPEIKIKSINLPLPQTEAGKNSLAGEIKRVTGEAVASATLWAIMPQSGYWQKTQSDSKGYYELEKLPDGNFLILAYISGKNGLDKAMLEVEVTGQRQKLPLLMLADNSNQIKIPSKIANLALDSEIWFYGEVIPMLYSDSNGYCGTSEIPEDYSLVSLNSEEETEENYSLSPDKQLLLNGKVSANATVAVMPEKDSWQLTFYRKFALKSAQDIVLTDLPPSLDSVISLTKDSATNSIKNKQEQAIIPGSPIELDSLPIAFKEKKSLVKLKLNFPKEASTKDKAIALDESGEEYEILNNSSEYQIPNGNYIIMTEIGDKRGLCKPQITDKKVVFIGTSLPTDQDFIITPINFLDKSFTRIPGVNAHANLFATLINQDFFYAPPFHIDRAPSAWPFYQWFLTLPIFYLLNIIFRNAESTKITLIVLIILFALAFTAAYLFTEKILVPVFFPSLLILSFSITRGFVEWINSRKLAKETQNAFGRFISADVVKQIIENPDRIRPGGEKKELTIIFTDIAGFTSISEKLEAEELTELMNSYLDEMTNILFKHGGTLDKYIGDAIMGFWNHPTAQEDHATRAVSCAIEMQKKLHELREKWIAQGLPKVEMRAGINSGTCMVGFMGSKTQMNFTCLGDSVNLASRLEGANKAYNTFIMVAESVKKRLNPYLFSIRFLDFLAVKGKDKPVLVYEVRGWIKEENDTWKNKAAVLYQQGIDSYLAREWDKAKSLFEEVLTLVPEDGPSKVYIERCLEFKLNPPPEKWDGRYILKTK